MTTLTIKFSGITERIIGELIRRGYAKTKTEALRYALLRTGQELTIQEQPEPEDSGAPLSKDEILYLRDSFDDLKNGRYTVFPADTSKEEFWRKFKAKMSQK